MKKVRLISVCVCICLATCIMSGCNKKQKNEEKKVSVDNELSYERKNAKVKLDKDIVVVADNCKITVSNNKGTNCFKFYVMTKEELKKDELKVGIGTDIKYDVTIREEGLNGIILGKCSPEERDIYITDITTLTHNGIDWNKYLEIEKKGDNEKLNEYTVKYSGEYSGVLGCFVYLVEVIFDNESIQENSEVDKMDIEYKGQKIQNNIKVKFVKDMFDDSREFSGAFSSLGEPTTIMETVEPNKEGRLTKYSESFKAEKNFVIKEIKCISDNGIEVESVDVTGSINNNIGQKMNGELEVKKGDTVYLSINLKDSEFSNQLYYYKNAIISMKYEVEKSGIIEEEQYNLNMYAATLPDELYAHYVDGVDMMKYYNEYHNIVNGLNY